MVLITQENIDPEDPEAILRFLQEPFSATEPLHQDQAMVEQVNTRNIIEPDEVLESLAETYEEVMNEEESIVSSYTEEVIELTPRVENPYELTPGIVYLPGPTNQADVLSRYEPSSGWLPTSRDQFQIIFPEEEEEEGMRTYYSVNTIYATIFRSNIQRNPSLIAATERHPFLSIPIGLDEEEGGPVIQGLLDTGAGLSIGFFDYWQDFAEKFPQYVKTFEPIDFSRFEKVCVAGIHVNGMSTPCTHC